MVGLRYCLVRRSGMSIFQDYGGPKQDGVKQKHVDHPCPSFAISSDRVIRRHLLKVALMHFLLSGDAVLACGKTWPYKLTGRQHGVSQRLRWELRHFYPSVNQFLSSNTPLCKLYKETETHSSAVLRCANFDPDAHMGRPAVSLKRLGLSHLLEDSSDEYWASTVGIMTLLCSYSVRRRSISDKLLCDALGESILSKTTTSASFDGIPLLDIDPSYVGLCDFGSNGSGFCSCVVSLTKTLGSCSSMAPQKRVWRTLKNMYEHLDCKACAKWLG